MDWRRITNKFKKETPEIKQENKECELQKEDVLQREDELQREMESQKVIIEQYLNGLLPELNLRLFLEMSDDEAVYVAGDNITDVIKWPQMMILAESITVTSYTNPVNMHQAKGRIFNRLTGKRAEKKSCTLKKYKKERR